MSKNRPDATPDDALPAMIAIVNSSDRMYKLSRYGSASKHLQDVHGIPIMGPGVATRLQTIVPGINFVKREFIRDALDLVELHDAVAVVDPSRILEPKKVIQHSVSPPALRTWLEQEKLPHVRAAIENRLAQI